MDTRHDRFYSPMPPPSRCEFFLRALLGELRLPSPRKVLRSMLAEWRAESMRSDGFIRERRWRSLAKWNWEFAIAGPNGWEIKSSGSTWTESAAKFHLIGLRLRIAARITDNLVSEIRKQLTAASANQVN
jgi:hypothetical protein